MKKLQDFKDWLNEDPSPSEIVKAMDTERDYMPIAWVEETLDHFDNWSTKNFNYRITRIGDAWFAEGHVDLEVSYGGITRTQVGAISFRVSSGDANTSYAPTVLSLCISNAATKLGRRFGRALNGRLDTHIPTQRAALTKGAAKPEEVLGVRGKIKPDMIIIKKYESAIRNGDQKQIEELTSMYDLKVE